MNTDNVNNMNIVKRIAVVAHDSRKNDLIEWSFHNREVLRRHELIAAGYTADVLEGTVNVPVCKLAAGQIGGYQQLADMINEAKVDAIIFLLQPKNSNDFENEMKTLLHLAEEKEIIIATNMPTAEVVISSSFLSDKHWQESFEPSPLEEKQAV
jgi:methylglyoxal synthase